MKKFDYRLESSLSFLSIREHLISYWILGVARARAADVLSRLPAELYSKDLQNKIEGNVFNWDNNATNKPAFDAFTKLTKGYSRLRKTFNPEQKEIADDN